MNKLFALFCVSLLCLATSCGEKKVANSKNATPEVKIGVAPVADNEIAVIELENSAAYGPIKLEFYSNIAPNMVQRFKELAREGFYNGVTFHRVSPQVVQGGDPFSRDDNPANDGSGESRLPDLVAEFSDVPFERGTVGAARLGNDVNSANCQFYISMQRNQGWDRKYTVFGKVIDGMSSADTIAGVPRNGEKPIEAVRIKQITIQAK